MIKLEVEVEIQRRLLALQNQDDGAVKLTESFTTSICNNQTLTVISSS
jgi:hypothetical protein